MDRGQIMGLIFFFIMFIGVYIPLCALFIWTLKNPKDSINWGRRTFYKNEEDLEPSEFTLDINKFRSILGIILITVIFIKFFIEIFK
ncbi:MAG: hypothetical protein FH753_05045 [Firmicutes bacterium]|nr:hypothetical protein [Bacillota bacterium]